MFLYSRFLACLLCISATLSLFGADDNPSLDEVAPLLHKMFSYHIENKEYSPLVAKRSFKVFIEQFDTDKVYLLKKEADLYIEMPRSKVAQAIIEYNTESYVSYRELNGLIVRSIDRHRQIRQEVYAELMSIEVFSENSGISDGGSGYCSSSKELKNRLKSKLYKMLYVKQQKFDQVLTVDKKQKLLALYEKKFVRMEIPYFYSDEKGKKRSEDELNGYLALHILKAVSKSLDAHSAYYSANEANHLRASLKKQFSGIGIVMKENEEGIFIMDVITGSPADKSKRVFIGDMLIEVNGKSLQDASFEEVMELLKGEDGAGIDVVLRRSEGSIEKVTLKREKIVLNDERLTYTYEPYADGVIGKIVLPGFYDNGEGINAEKDLREALVELKSKGPIYGLVIDMRENSGGFLSQAVKIAGLFITKGIVVISKYANGEIRYMRDIDGRMYYSGPLLLLTSKASASAAEIVAQALQDYGVALVVGDARTYGKGSMQYQTVTDEGAKSFFKVTVGKYYTISGKSTQIEGVRADIVVPTVYSPFNIGEKYLEYPLSNDHLDVESSFSEIGGIHYRVFQKKYRPLFEMRDQKWQKMVPTLKENSKKRLAKDENFQCFIRYINGDKQDRKLSRSRAGVKVGSDMGVEDLHMRESVNIIKDMILMDPTPAN